MPCNANTNKSMNLLPTSVCLIICIMAATFGVAQKNDDARNAKEQDIVGEWKIDLRPTPNAEAYYQVFRVETVEENAMTGSFYGSQIENGLINTNWPEIHFAFTTSDATFSYYHSGFLKGTTLYGTTYCPGRKLVAKWTGRRSL